MRSYLFIKRSFEEVCKSVQQAGHTYAARLQTKVIEICGNNITSMVAEMTAMDRCCNQYPSNRTLCWGHKWMSAITISECISRFRVATPRSYGRKHISDPCVFDESTEAAVFTIIFEHAPHWAQSKVVGIKAPAVKVAKINDFDRTNIASL